MASSAGKSGNSYDYLIKLMLIGDSGEHPPANALALAVSCSAIHGSDPAHPPRSGQVLATAAVFRRFVR